MCDDDDDESDDGLKGENSGLHSGDRNMDAVRRDVRRYERYKRVTDVGEARRGEARQPR